MKVKDLFAKQNIDIDVCDNYVDELCIAYCGTQLKPEGKEKFKEILDLPLCFYEENNVATIEIDRKDRSEKECNRLLKLASKLFYGAAGYCSEEFYDKYFI